MHQPKKISLTLNISTECMLHPPLGNQVWSFVSPKGALTSNEPEPFDGSIR